MKGRPMTTVEILRELRSEISMCRHMRSRARSSERRFWDEEIRLKREEISLFCQSLPRRQRHLCGERGY